MPIKFECVFCGRRLGIARRKAGAVVKCPGCKKQLIVPNPDPSDDLDRYELEDDQPDPLPPTGKLPPVPIPSSTAQVPATTHTADVPTSGKKRENLFEQSDFLDNLLTKPNETPHAPSVDSRAQQPPAPARVFDGSLVLPQPIEPRVYPEPLPIPQPSSETIHQPVGYYLSSGKATLLVVCVVVLLAVAFAGGYLVGKGS